MPARIDPSRRPIRDLIWPDVEQPLPMRSGGEERRRYHRYPRDGCYASLLLSDVAHIVRCVDLGYGGLRVIAPPETPLSLRQHVQIRMNRWARTFEDRYSVRAVAPARDGIAVHLALEPHPSEEASLEYF